jgi:hypothetical protein
MSFVKEGAKPPITSQKKKNSIVTHHRKWHIFWDQESATCLVHTAKERLKIYPVLCDNMCDKKNDRED